MDSALLLDAMKRARPALTRILRYRLDDIDDVLQKAAISALTTKSLWRRESEFSSWFLRIAINQALMHIRKPKTQRIYAELSPIIPSRIQTPEQYAIRNEERAELVSAIKRLTPKRRAAVLSIFLGDEANSCSAKSRRHQARVRLRWELTRG